MVKRITYLIVGISVFFAITISVYLYMEHSRIKVMDVSEAEVVNGSEKVIITGIEDNGGSTNITGYINEDEPIATVNLSIILWDDVSDTYYKIPTEFVEVASVEEVDTLMRHTTGFQGSFALERLEGKTDGFIICVYDQSNGIKRLFITSYIL